VKRFTYRLQHLLRLREQQEEMAKLALGQATRRCDEIKLGIANAQIELAGLVISVFDLMMLQARDAYQRRLQQRIKKLETDLVTAEEARQVAIRHYNHCRQEAEILRKMRHKQWDEFRRDLLHQEDANLDDMVAARHVSA
jgi:flagellar export protein FliJ